NTRYPDDSDGQIRRSQSEAIRKRFLETIQKYQDVERIYKQKYRQRVERQIRIVKPDASPEEVDNLIDSDESPQVFAQSELHQLFQDMQMLVEQQGTVLTQAEQNAETTVGHLEQGNTMIGKAIRSARATRHVSN
ncbi:t-SNARE, partial [Syncephalastrum racemosum]